MSGTPSQDANDADRQSEQQSEQTAQQPQNHQKALVNTVGQKAQRRLAAQEKGKHSLWFGLGAFGIVGWSIAVPTLLGVALGLWLDFTWSGPFSWTLALLLAGVTIGCFNAWYWVSREQEQMEAEHRERQSD